MSDEAGREVFGSRCVFCRVRLFSVGRDGSKVDLCAPLLFLCPGCGAYRLCLEFATFLADRPARLNGVRKFVIEAALEGYLPRLCVDHQDFEEIASPIVRAWQKCRGCRNGPPKRTAEGWLVHPAEGGLRCRAGDEWREVGEASVRTGGPLAAGG